MVENKPSMSVFLGKPFELAGDGDGGGVDIGCLSNVEGRGGLGSVDDCVTYSAVPTARTVA